METTSLNFTPRFSEYFNREVAQSAAKSIADGAEMLFQIAGSDGKVQESFTFTRSGGKNQIVATPAQSPHLVFTLTPSAAEQVLSDPSDEIGAIGINIMKLVTSPDANRRVSVKLKAGFITLFTQGYFGVITTGGGAFASFLASKGLNGMGAIKSALKKMQG